MKGRMKVNRTTRPLEEEEYKAIVELLENGFELNGIKIRPKTDLVVALQLQANLGLRIGDVLRLKVENFKQDKLETVEQKTGKLQWRQIHPMITATIKDYAIEKGLKSDDRLFDFDVRNAQKYLSLAAKKLNLNHIGSHSLRKMFCSKVYDETRDLELVKELLNHTSVATTQRYVRVSQQRINEVSSRVYFNN